ncbi:MAG: HAD-IIIA family hydrolase, partial [Candidatus Sumerlaeota bacterium]|nr:HAD-IIIA family hydrolase [Candidatus Sumerlaeota bacterium]
QAAVARGLLTLDDLEAIHRRMADLLADEAGARLDAVYFCPHHPDPAEPTRVAEFCLFCECRKPAPGMLLRAARELNLDLKRSFLIGDSTRDILAGQRAGCQTVLLIGVGHRGRDAQCVTTPTQFAVDLPEAVEWVLSRAGSSE